MSSDSSHCNIVALNAKAIQLVHHSNDREAIKLFLQALSRLKSELNSCHKHSTNPEDGAFLRVPLLSTTGTNNTCNKSDDKKLGGNKLNGGSCALFDRLLGLCSNVDPCCPEVRDGATALLLYNAGVTEHHMAIFQDTNPQQQSLHLKKASQCYNMAFSAAQHWKRYTIEHSGYSVLCLAILNNLLSIQNTDGGEKVSKLKVYLKDELAMAKNTITDQERSFFANNLDQLMNMNSSNNHTSASTGSASSSCSNESNSENSKESSPSSSVVGV